MYMASKAINCVSGSAKHILSMQALHLPSMKYMNCMKLTMGNSVKEVAMAALSMFTKPNSCNHRSLLGLFSAVYGMTVLSKMLYNCQN